MYCHTLQPGECVKAPLIEWRTDLHAEPPPEGIGPWVLTLRKPVDNLDAYLAKSPAYLQIELGDRTVYPTHIPKILALHLDHLDSLDPIDELMSHEAELYKIAAIIDDPIFLMRFFKRVQKEPRLIGIAMGERGQMTRALSRKLNNPLTFVGEIAPGQLTSESLEKHFKFSRQSEKTRIIGLLGDPLHNSPGIHYHNAYFEKEGLDICYVNIPIKERLAEFLEEVPEDFIGFSVTMPLKQEAKLFALDKSPAINTLKRQNGKWVGINTDGLAVKAALEKRLSLSGKKIAILGTGGLAKSIHHQIGGELIPRVALGTFDPEPYDIILQATSCGMLNDELPISTIPKNKLVLEGVNRETPFQKACQLAGCEVITGHELFERQAKLQQMFWQ